jgi:hypothetical protein
MKQLELQGVRMFEFDGTRRGFDLMMLRMFPYHNWAFMVSWVDEKFNQCHTFKGIVMLNESGLILRKGDWYHV